jgi:hypothetical protein
MVALHLDARVRGWVQIIGAGCDARMEGLRVRLKLRRDRTFKDKIDWGLKWRTSVNIPFEVIARPAQRT